MSDSNADNQREELSSSVEVEPNEDYVLKEVFCRYITKNGKRIYPKKAKCFHFFVKVKK